MNSYVSIQIPAALYNEVVLRTMDPQVDVSALVSKVFSQFLDRTKDDDIWSPEHLKRRADRHSDEWREKYGEPESGYVWKSMLIKNGSKVRMDYKGAPYFAEVMHGHLMYDYQTMSPSEFASKVANNTARNAWRDLWIKGPDDEKFLPAQEWRDRIDDESSRMIAQWDPTDSESL